MGQTTVRISEATRDLLRSLAATERRPMQAIVATALEAYRRERFLNAVNAGYAVLREDQAAWAEFTHERGVWDSTLLDGLSAKGIGSRRVKARRGRRTAGRPG